MSDQPRLDKSYFSSRKLSLPVFDMTESKFLDADTADAFSRALQFEENGLSIRFIHLNSLIQAKKAAGRHKDLHDIEKLTSGS